jgi:hypothetical protein
MHSTVDLLVLTSVASDIAIIIYWFTNQASLLRRSTVLRLSLQSVFPDCTFKSTNCIEEGLKPYLIKTIDIQALGRIMNVIYE